VLALVVFAFPLGIWLAFSRSIVSRGGLSAFVEAAFGRRVALAHAGVWALAYFLYLPYTITFVVYDLLAPLFPGLVAYRSSLELVLPVVLVLVALAPLRLAAGALALVGVAQLVTMLVLAGFEYGHTSPSFAASPTVNDTGRAVGGTALLFVCASLPLYLGAETRGGGRTIRRGLVAAVAIVGAVFLVAAVPLADVPDRLRDSLIPGAAIARAYSGRGLEVAVGLLTVASTLALIVAEYLALARLLNWASGTSVRSVTAWIAVPFVVADAISLVDPDRFYDDLLKPSLGALFVSLLVVALAFPRFRRGPVPIVASLVGSGLAVWGLYTLVTGGSST
jgi:amino acid transporter